MISLFTLLVLSGCSHFYSEQEVVVEWADAVKWNDKQYYYDEEKSRQKRFKRFAGGNWSDFI